MRSITDYNKEQKFNVNLQESRLKKCVKLINKITPGKFLDIGCSQGDWSLYWKQQGWNPFGIDVDREHIQIAQKKGIQAEYCDLNADKLPFEDNYFDLIFAGEVIEHIIDTDHFISEVKRCTKPGGFIILTTPNLVSFENRMRILCGIYPIWVNYDLSGAGHIRAYTPRVLKKQLVKFGFTIFKHTGNWVPFLPQRLVNDTQFPLMAFTGSLLPNLAMDIIIMAQKRAS